MNHRSTSLNNRDAVKMRHERAVSAGDSYSLFVTAGSEPALVRRMGVYFDKVTQRKFWSTKKPLERTLYDLGDSIEEFQLADGQRNAQLSL